MDYRGIEALSTVQELQSFEDSAKKLRITQSAISQRIKGLETYYGEPVLIRTLPYRATKLGKQLIGHYKRISLLEESFQLELRNGTLAPSISISINRDSLETWFLSVINESEVFSNLTLDIVADDQELTINHLKNGLVSACLSTQANAILGGKVQFLGHMEYVLAASPEFIKKYFSEGSSKKCLTHAPAIKFDHKDMMHERYLEKYFNLNGDGLRFQIIPSVRGFKKFAILGYGYGLIPRIDILDELKSKSLIQLYPDKVWNVSLYWHSWAVESTFYRKFNSDMIRLISKQLKNV